MAHICQARLLLPQPKIFFQDGHQVFLTTICGRQSENTLCAACSRWEPIHGLVTTRPPPHSHSYGSDWFEEKLKAGSKISLRDKLFLKAAAEAATAGRIHRLRQEQLAKPKEAKPRPRIIIKSMPPRKTAAQPPPPPSSPTQGSLPSPPSPSGAVAKVEPKKKRAKAAATPSRKRSPTARIADRADAPAVGIGEDFERTQQRVEALKSLLHVFEPAFFEEDGEPLEADEYEYVKLHKIDDRGDLLQEEQTGQQFSYSIEKGIVTL